LGVGQGGDGAGTAVTDSPAFVPRGADGSRVSDSVAPTTMFQRMKGENNADIVQTTTRYLSKFAYQLSDLDQKADVSIVYNVRLIRDVPPYNKNPYKKRERWNEKDLFAKSGIGSKVDCAASSTTFKQKVTIY
jgi:hypothetical protein